ncbi:LON peptidase substrate-binding domain-containing protein [Pontibacter cellulosilyticus]|uniref:LON peptidase substrate-binding domain-containing protein n=1 Tax=Pontibacter cellulosilyticus TaxID=1720253 RepID=A0A923N3F7_9BACT|nr:LON peptidase substrate-binding domain-containing protein [Pontibacter cellulosilyticus]MBC5991459.1 LON peptidase substrate-binding domain-containing protein [Pontibacter cellulosilyticus]
MAKYLPLFPLSIVVFPGEKLNLHIFEPRYKQLVLDCIENEKTFGIPTYIQSNVGVYGTEMEILEVEKTHANGEMDIRTKGKNIFKIEQFDKMAPGRLYAGGQVEVFENDFQEDIMTKLKIKDLLQKLYNSLGLEKLFTDLLEDFKSYDIGHHLGLNTEQEYTLLQLRTEIERQEAILQHLQQVVPIVKATEQLKERVKQNGHFKNLTPPNF